MDFMANRAVGLMPKKEFIRNLAQKLEITQATAEIVMVACEEVILDGLQTYNKVKFADLVSFTKQDVPARAYKLPGDEHVQMAEACIRIVPTMIEANKNLKPRDHAE